MKSIIALFSYTPSLSCSTKLNSYASSGTLKRVLQNSDMSVMGVPAGERSALKGASSSFFSSHPLKAYCSCTCGRSLSASLWRLLKSSTHSSPAIRLSGATTTIQCSRPETCCEGLKVASSVRAAARSGLTGFGGGGGGAGAALAVKGLGMEGGILEASSSSSSTDSVLVSCAYRKLSTVPPSSSCRGSDSNDAPTGADAAEDTHAALPPAAAAAARAACEAAPSSSLSAATACFHDIFLVPAPPFLPPPEVGAFCAAAPPLPPGADGFAAAPGCASASLTAAAAASCCCSHAVLPGPLPLLLLVPPLPPAAALRELPVGSGPLPGLGGVEGETAMTTAGRREGGAIGQLV
mmetsp:Transcript_10746/g.27973  ORF Transcript_10746/g.27973 Transcript_10746/m.27973 type:complete len:351 (+) Transcript_10746:3719-4771(+)